MPNVACVSILDCTLRFLYRLFTTYSLSYVLCTQCFLCLWFVHSWWPLLFSLPFIYYLQSVLCLVYPMLPCIVSRLSICDGPLCFLYRLSTTYSLSYVLCTLCCHVLSLDCPFLMAPFVFSTVYLLPTVCPMSCVPIVLFHFCLNCLLVFVLAMHSQCCQCL